MAEANPMICSDCGGPMNHHADKVRKETHPDDVSAFDSGLGGLTEEFHTCPQCGKTQSRRAPHSETSNQPTLPASSKIDRALGTIANDANLGVSQVKARSSPRSLNS